MTDDERAEVERIIKATRNEHRFCQFGRCDFVTLVREIDELRAARERDGHDCEANNCMDGSR